MYSPKIREDLIPVLYRIGKAEQKPMTRVVDEILRGYLMLKEQYSQSSHDGVLEKLILSQEISLIRGNCDPALSETAQMKKYL